MEAIAEEGPSPPLPSDDGPCRRRDSGASAQPPRGREPLQQAEPHACHPRGAAREPRPECLPASLPHHPKVSAAGRSPQPRGARVQVDRISTAHAPPRRLPQQPGRPRSSQAPAESVQRHQHRMPAAGQQVGLQISHPPAGHSARRRRCRQTPPRLPERCRWAGSCAAPPPSSPSFSVSASRATGTRAGNIRQQQSLTPRWRPRNQRSRRRD